MNLSREKKNVAVLFVCQALFITIWTMMTIVGGLTGAALATNKALATLPFTAMIIGNAMATVPAALLMKRVGRRAGFMVGTAICAAGAAIAAYAVYGGDFWLFVAGGLIMGIFAGFAQFYRFAAADTASPRFKSRAISLVVAGGLVAAVAAPGLTEWANEISPVAFAGSFVVMAGLAALTSAVLAILDIPQPEALGYGHSGRPLPQIIRQPVFVVAALGGMVSYGAMLLVMTASPLAIVACGYDVNDAAFVIQGHVVGMFAPALFTGALIERFGVLNIMLTGVVLLMACAAIALSGIDIVQFWLAMLALGLGWNFAFIGASTLLTESYTPEEREKVQGINDFLVFSTVALASLSSGAILHFFSWNAVQWTVLPFVAVSGAATLWLILRRRAERQAVATGSG
ncbi:MAG: MFS transporter [Rhodospirillales bacterium]|jgi:MFS family permease|nr:MFS transporter [Rhodospirillales bacterium]MDP6772989.1 MFS transporter [Rhodospirillales bacterium]